MYLDCRISVVIAGKSVETVSEVHVSGHTHKIGQDCEITVPLNCLVKYQNGTHDTMTALVTNLFQSGDVVTVTAWYVGYPPLTIFSGYVFGFKLGMPTKIICQDSIFLLWQAPAVNLAYKSVGFVDLMSTVLAGTGITLMPPVIDFQLINITFKEMTPAAVLEYFKKELFLCINLIGTQLYINIASNTTSSVTLDTTRNVIKSDLQLPGTAYQKVRIKACFLNPNGTKSSFMAGDEEGELHEFFLPNILSEAQRQQFANEAVIRCRQKHYNGKVETYLYPDCDLYYKISYTDYRYPERNGQYVITGKDIHLDRHGFHRDLTLAYFLPSESAA